MRITCIFGPFAPVPPVLGGAVERIFLALCRQFAKQGHEVTLIARRFEGMADEESVDGMHILRIPSFDAPRSKLAYRLLDVVYAVRASAALPPSDVTITHSVSLPLIIPKSKAGKLYVSVGRFPKGQMGFYRRADRLQAVSAHVANAIIEQNPSTRDRVRTVPNALGEGFCGAMRPGRGPRAREILYVGRLAREKGIDLLLRAFLALAVRHPDWRLVVVGPHEARHGGDGGEFLTELKALAAPVADRVDFVGPIFDEDVLIARMRQADVFAYPSVAAQGESFGLAPLEAMACGCAVVVSDLECFSDFLQPERNGLQFDQSDASGASLAAALERLIGSQELRDRLAGEAVRSAANFTPEAVANLFVEDFRDLLGANDHG